MPKICKKVRSLRKFIRQRLNGEWEDSRVRRWNMPEIERRVAFG